MARPTEMKRDRLCANRKNTLKKRAEELEKLCCAEVCIIFGESDGNLELWATNADKARATIVKYKEGAKKIKKNQKGFGDSLILDSKIQALEERIRFLQRKYNNKVDFGADLEGADNLAANLMAFENFAAENNLSDLMTFD